MDYNEGLTCSGLKFSGSTDQDYAYYLDHNGKKDIRSRARPLFECVLPAGPRRGQPGQRLTGAETGRGPEYQADGSIPCEEATTRASSRPPAAARFRMPRHLRQKRERAVIR